jgi:protein gp37
MQKTKIEWVKNFDGTQGYSWNPIRGLCPVACFYCYARRQYKRFGLDPAPRLDESEIYKPMNRWINTRPGKFKTARIFVCSTFDIFHPVADRWRDKIFYGITMDPDDTFIVLTKLPERIDRPMPPNVWLGVTVETGSEWDRAKELRNHKAAVKFVSFEPILGKPQLGDFRFTADEFDWFILGRLTGHGNVNNPELGTLKNIVEIARKYNRPVFMKNNLKDIWKGPLIQEFPKPRKKKTTTRDYRYYFRKHQAQK